MASLEEGEEASENEEGMTTFGPYVAERSGRAQASMNTRTEGSQRGRVQHPAPQQRRPTANKVRGEPENTGIGAAKDLFRKIRSSLTMPQGPPPPPGPSSHSSSSSAGTSRKPTTQGQPARRQHRPSANQPAKNIPHPSSAPVLNKAQAAGARKPSRAATRASPQPPKNEQNRSRETSPCSPKVFEDMASYGPGSGRNNQSPTAVPPLAHKPVQPKPHSEPQVHTPLTSQKVELREPRVVDDSGKVSTDIRYSISGDAHITLVSYSDVHLQRVALSSVGGGSRSVGDSAPNTAAALPQRLKKQLNKQDVLKRIGSIENDEESSSDLKRYWMPDKACKECSECGAKFNWFLRRHHCRICGRIFCNTCCSLTIQGDLLRRDLQGNLRVCRECHTIFRENNLSKLESSGQQLTESFNSNTTLPASQTLEAPPTSVSESGILRSVSGAMSRTMSVRPVNMLSQHKSWDEASLRNSEISDMSPSRTSVLELDRPSPLRRTLTTSRRQNNFDSTLIAEPTEEKIVALEKDEVDYIVSEVWSKFLDPECGLQPQNHRHRLRNFPKSYTAHTIVVWLLTNRYVESRDVAIRVGQTLVDANRLKIVSSIESRFRDDFHLYLELGDHAHLPLEGTKEPTVQGAPKWFHNLPQDGDSEFENSYGPMNSPGIQTAMTKRDSTDPSITITSLQRISESEPMTSSTPKGAGEEYIVIDQDLSEHVEEKETDEMSSNSPLSSTPILPDVLASRSPSSNEALSLSKSPVPSFDMIGTDEIIKALPISRVTGLESASEAAKDVSSRDTRQKAERYFIEEHDYHFDALMIQLIKSFGLSLSWLNVIKPLVKEAARNVKTNVFQDDMMDINHYVKVKKIPGGRQSNSNLVYGVVCTKNVTHKKMETSIQNPTILLLRCAFEFQRRENTLSYFDTLQLQEEQYLKNVVAKVKAFRPSIILVQKSMSRLALEMLYELGIIVAVNVKQSVMNRVARCTEGAILSSLDQLFFDVRLGHCGHFYIRNYTLPDGVKKTLMYFDLCERQYGCVITLQGASNRELKKVKKITQFGLHVAHNSNLETSFLIDEFAWPKSGITDPPRLLPSSDDYSPTPSTPEWPLYPSLSYPLDSLSPEELAERLKQLDMSREDEEESNKGDEEQEQASFEAKYEQEEEEDEDEKQGLSQVGEDEVDGSATSDEGPLSHTTTLSDLNQTEETSESKASVSEVSLSESELLETVDAFGNREEDLERVDSGLIFKMNVCDDKKETDSTRLDTALREDKRLEKMSVVEFQKAMEGQILSISPGVQLTTPYLQTVEGRSADARQYLPNVIYWSNKFDWGQATRDKKDRSSSKSSPFLPHGSSGLEMGLSQQRTGDEECNNENQQNGIMPYQHRPSYKSVSSHPLTNSIFVLHANTNEMKSALADYRARASLPSEENCFFFPSARLACDYQHHLQDVFNAYKHYNFETVHLQSGKSEENREDLDEKKDIQKKKKGGHRFPWKHHHSDEGGLHAESADKALPKQQPLIRMSSCTHDNPLIADEFKPVAIEDEGREGDGEESTRRGESAEPADQEAEQAEIAEPPVATESSTKSEVHDTHSEKEKEKEVTLSDDSHKSSRSSGSHKMRGEVGVSSGSRFSDKFMTLDDLDKLSHTPKPQGETEEEMAADLSYEQWVTGDQHMDCLDPYNHQGISILFSNTSHDGAKNHTACVPPCIIPMFFYGRNDISLGDFLLRYCFRPYYRCPACGAEMSKHKRHIVHGPNAIYINMQLIDPSLLGNDDGIYTWLACKHCAQCTPYTEMSKESLLFSFAKFLELKFHCDSYITRHHGDAEAPCTHSLHGEYIQYFVHKNKLAAFQPATIDIYEVLMPPKVLSITTPHHKYHHNYAAEIRHVQRMVERAFDGLLKKLAQYQVFEVYSHDVEENIANAKAERETLRIKDKHLKRLAVTAGFMEPLPHEHFPEATIAPEADKVDENLYWIQDGIEELKRSVTEVVECWNIILEDLDAKVRDRYSGSKKLREGEGAHHPTEITFTKSPRDSPRLIIAGESHSHNEEEEGSNRGSTRDLTDSITPIHTPTDGSPVLSRRHNSSGQSTLTPSKLTHSRNHSDSGVKQPEEKRHKRQLSESFAISQKNDKALATSSDKLESEGRDSGSDQLGSFDGLNGGGAGGGASASTSTKESSSGTGTGLEEAESNHGNSDGSSQVNSEYESIKRLNVMKSDSDHTPSTPPTVHSDATGGDVVSSKSDLTDGNSQGVPARAKGGATNGNGATSDLQSSRQHNKRSGGAQENNKRGLKSSILSRPFQKLDCPFDLSEHHTMYRSASLPVAIYEKEPTSFIAFALTSREYAEELQAMVERKTAALGTTAAMEAKMTLSASPKSKKKMADNDRPHSSSAGNLRTAAAALNFKAAFQELKKKGSAMNLFSTTPTAGVPPPFPSATAYNGKSDIFARSLEYSAVESTSSKSHDGELLSGEHPRISPSSHSLVDEMDTVGKGSEHISLEFTTPDKTVSFFCKVYYAEEFRKLRELIFPSGEDRYIRSLARCVKYDAKGGKSRSTFCKVADDRFIMKHIKSIEISSFEQFAPHYLEHVNKALEEKRPLALAKIVGAYSIGFRNTKTGNSKRLDVLVMENLLYGHSHTNTKLFDLKGSMRSRYIDPSKDSSGDVLLDTNYLNYICQSPVYVYPHSKNILMQAIIADTEFLEENTIMDYSLLTCIDSSTGELVVGIIDYVRTFTLDKRLEMFLKKKAGRGLPTIVDPELYRKRFLEAMDRYFTVIPDEWTGLGADVPEGMI